MFEAGIKEKRIAGGGGGGGGWFFDKSEKLLFVSLLA